VEVSYQQQLRFLPAPFDGLAFMANATFVDSEAVYPTRPGEKLPFIGQSDVSGNFALTYEKHGFFARVAVNWRDAHLREDEPIGVNRDDDRWIDDYYQIDLSTSYRINRNLEVFAEMTNLTNEPFRVFFESSNGQGRRLVQHEEYDWTANFGVRWRL
jgi:TonB-dependent receptor